MSKLKISDDEKEMHAGHRKRLVDLVDRVGLDSVTPIQALEYTLCFIFPRGDVNPLAHRLLKRFNDFSTVLEASVEDLQEVKGMGETSAKKLRSLLDVFYYYTLEKLADGKTLRTIGDFYDYIEQLLRFRPEEELYLFGVNASGEVTKGRKFERGSNNQVTLHIREITLYISTHKVNAVLLVHNHPNGSAQASQQDVDSYEDMKRAVNASGCQLIDMAIVGANGIYSLESQSMKRLFSEGLEYTQAISQLNCR